MYLRLSAADRASRLFAVAAAVAIVVLIAAGRGITFGADDWAFVGQREAWDLATFMRPHNEHWSAVPVLAYKLLLATVGLRTYLPYQLVAVLLHVCVAAALFRVIRRDAGPTLAVASSVLFLFLGYGGENMVWGFQMGWNAAMAAGALALVLSTGERDRRHMVAAAVLLVVAVASSGVGLVFVPVIALAVALTGGRPALRERLWVLIPATVIYGVWYTSFGASAVQSGLLDPARLRDLPDYVALGIGNAFGRTTGWGPEPGLVLALVVLIATIWRLLGPRSVLIGTALGFAGLFVQFGLTGLSRVQFGVDQAAAPRYVYTGGFFVLLVLASWLATVRLTRARTRSLATLGVLLAFALGANLYGLAGIRSYHVHLSNETRAAMDIAMQYGGSPALPARVGWLSVPGRDRLAELTAAYGSPRNDVLGATPEPPPEAYDAVLLDLFGTQLYFVSASVPAPTEVTAPVVTEVVDALVTAIDGCAALVPAGRGPAATAHVPGGATLVVYPDRAGSGPTPLRVNVALRASFIAEGVRETTLARDVAAAMTLPDLGPAAVWQLRVEGPSTTPMRLCLTGPTRSAHARI